MYKDDKRKMWIKEITIKITMKNVKVSTCTIAACVGLTRRLKKLTDAKISTFAVQARCTRKRELTFSFRHLYEIKFTRKETVETILFTCDGKPGKSVKGMGI